QAKWKVTELGACETPRPEALIKAGSRLYLGGAGRVLALDLPLKEGAALAWETEVDGTVASLIAADDRLFAVTSEARIACFGAPRAETITHGQPKADAEPADSWAAKARAVLDAAGVRDGYCIAWGVGSGRLITELVRQSSLHVIAVERDADKV